MNVYGIDFTSSPSSCNTKAKAAKWMSLARCTLDQSCLTVESIDMLNGVKKDDYSILESQLSSVGPWIAGIDVPFGMPVECVEYFQWIKTDDENQNWTAYVERCRKIASRKSFKALVEGWRHPIRTNEKGEKERVRKYRIIDKLIGAQSPMNCIRPAVGSMFYEACGILKKSPASIPPIRYKSDERRVIVEAYPRLVVDRLIGPTNYKEADELEKVRQEIMNQVTSTDEESPVLKWYGLHVRIADDLVEECVNDREGDRIDSVLCAVQAAWAFGQRNFGMPQFISSVMRDVLALEGWVADPLPFRFAQPVNSPVTPSAHDILSGDREPFPSWLLTADEFNAEDFFSSRVVYYPGSGTDWQAFDVFCRTHSAHCVLHIDQSKSAVDVESALEQGILQHFNGYELRVQTILARVHAALNPEIFPDRRVRSVESALWIVLERQQNLGDEHGPKRIAFLHIQAEAVWVCHKVWSALDQKPFAVILQDHGYGGNWTTFGGENNPLYEFQRQRTLPKWLLVGERTESWPMYIEASEPTPPAGEYAYARKLHRQQ